MQSDLFAIEVYNGHIYVHLDLGAGPIKQRGSRKRIDDGVFHDVIFRRTGREARITVDGFHTDFKTAGMYLKTFSFIIQKLILFKTTINTNKIHYFILRVLILQSNVRSIKMFKAFQGKLYLNISAHYFYIKSSTGKIHDNKKSNM